MSDNSTALAQARQTGLAAFTTNQLAKAAAFGKRAKDEGVTDGLYIRMNGKSGKFISNYPNMPEFDSGSEFVFDMYNSVLLWQGFDNDNKPYNGPRVTIESGQELPPHEMRQGVKWIKQLLVMVCAPDGGKPIALTAKADNPFRSSLKLVAKYGDEMTKHPDPTSKTGFMTPIVRISSEEKNTKKDEEVVKTDPVTKEKTIVVESVPIQYFVEKFEIVDWISQKEMDEIKEAAGLSSAAEEAASAAPAPAAPAQVTQQQAPSTGAASSTGAAPVKATVEAEIIPPAAKEPSPEISSFRRNRAGQTTGVRTA